MASKRRPRTRPKTDALSELMALGRIAPKPDTAERRLYATAVGYPATRGWDEAERDAWCVKMYGRTFAEIRAGVGNWADVWDRKMAEFNDRLQAWDERWRGVADG